MDNGKTEQEALEYALKNGWYIGGCWCQCAVIVWSEFDLWDGRTEEDRCPNPVRFFFVNDLGDVIYLCASHWDIWIQDREISRR